MSDKDSWDICGEYFYRKYNLSFIVKLFEEVNEMLVARSDADKFVCSRSFPCLENCLKFLPLNPRFVGEIPKNYLENDQQTLIHIELDEFPLCAMYNENDGSKNLVLTESSPTSTNAENADEVVDLESRRITCVSRNARHVGIKPGMTYAEAVVLSKDKDVISPPCDLKLIYETCLNFFTAISNFTSAFEASNCDEAFINVTELLQTTTGEIHKDILEHIIFTLQHHISVISNATATIGVGKNRLLARLATRVARQKGQPYYYLKDAYVDNYMKILAIEVLPLTPIAAIILKKLYSINTCGDLRNVGLKVLKKDFGEMGQRLFEFASGESTVALKNSHAGIPVLTFGEASNLSFTQREEFDGYLNSIASEAEEKLVYIRHRATIIILGIKFSSERDGENIGRLSLTSLSKLCRIFPFPSNDKLSLLNQITELWTSCNLKSENVKGLTVTFVCRESDNCEQPFLPAATTCVNSNVLKAVQEKTKDVDVKEIKSKRLKSDGLLLVECKNSPDFLTFIKEQVEPPSPPLGRLNRKRKLQEVNSLKNIKKKRAILSGSENVTHVLQLQKSVEVKSGTGGQVLDLDLNTEPVSPIVSFVRPVGATSDSELPPLEPTPELSLLGVLKQTRFQAQGPVTPINLIPLSLPLDSPGSSDAISARRSASIPPVSRCPFFPPSGERSSHELNLFRFLTIALRPAASILSRPSTRHYRRPRRKHISTSGNLTFS